MRKARLEPHLEPVRPRVCLDKSVGSIDASDEAEDVDQGDHHTGACSDGARRVNKNVVASLLSCRYPCSRGSVLLRKRNIFREEAEQPEEG